ncbi:unnamed protein product [Parnassius apollo]|uniref:(apollo) hypothetical protein n=1 Tax=Parnassius apollo TaxID=110799 RepID=A0A8S3X214_PARAO|nr:unnamed protein product [Parnassius apollo]
MSKEIAEEYASSLADLTVNSKPLINMLTILAEENIEHAGVIVDTVEKHLEKVHPDIKLPVLYLVDSIIKNVGGAYTQKFAQIIVNMFTRTFKQVDEKIRSQMFKLRETWHDVFPATKLYQLDVKVNLIDPAWPIQAQPQQSNIHVNPNFLKKTAAPTTSTATPLTEEEEKMRSILAKKEQELLMLQRKKIEMELEQTRRQLELAEKNAKKVVPVTSGAPVMPVALVSPVPSSIASTVPAPVPLAPPVSIKQRLGPPVNKPPGGRIAPVSGPLVTARRDPRLARRPPPQPQPTPPNHVPHVGHVPHPAHSVHPVPNGPPIAPNVFDIKPLERVIKRKNVITIDVRPETAIKDPRRRDPRLSDRPRERRSKKSDEEKADKRREDLRVEREAKDKAESERSAVDNYIDRLQIPDPKKINKLPPIPKINKEENKDEDVPAPTKRRKENPKERRKKKDQNSSKDSNSSSSSPEKRQKTKESKKKGKEKIEVEEKPSEEPEVVTFKELKNFNKDRYMRRNKEKSESPERVPEEKKEVLKPSSEPSNVLDVVVENKDIDLRVLHPVITDVTPAPVAQKRSSTETLEGKVKKNKLDKFDILFGNEDVDLRQLPQVEEVIPPPPPVITESPKADVSLDDQERVPSPKFSPKQKDWNEVKEKKDDTKKTPSKLDLVRAKLAEATKGKDRLGRPLLFSKSPSIERERRRTMSSDDADPRSDSDDVTAEDHKKTISIIMSQAKEQFSDGKLDKNQYNTLMYQVLQLNEKLKLKEAKQRESLELSKRKLKAHIDEENHKVASPKMSPSERNNFGDIDERITPAVFVDTPSDSQNFMQDSDMRMNTGPPIDGVDGGRPKGLLPLPPMMPMFMGPYPMWRGPRMEDFGPRRFRGPMPPFFRGKFDNRMPRPPFDVRLPLPPLPAPKLGMCQGESPLIPYERVASPPPIGTPGHTIPPTNFQILEYIDQDPVKTIQIDGVPREIRFYGETAVIMLDWDDPREIKFLPGCRRVTFDNKDSVMLNFNEGYKQVEMDDQVFNIRFGAPTRELYINGRWYECFFGGQPLGVIIDGKPRLVHLEGPLPQVDIGKTKRTDLVAGKINLIINATQMCPVYLDAKVQKILINGQFFTLRFVDALRTVLINEKPFKVEFGDLPRPLFIGKEKYFIRFSALPRNIKPGQVQIADMEGIGIETPVKPAPVVDNVPVLDKEPVGIEEEPVPRPDKSPSPVGENQGLDMLASLMPSSIAPASGSEYSVAEPLYPKSDKIPGLETPSEEKPANPLPILGNININDLFAKLVATGIVQMPEENKEKTKTEETKPKEAEDKNIIHKVDLLKPETLKIKQPALVRRLYGGMQCSGCGARFPPEHTVRYSQHLDWHFRQNRRERDSARRAHSRPWHYDLPDWLRYEELDELDEREKNWFEANAASGEFYNEDREEWHLRNAVTHLDRHYHPLCLADYKASLAKEEPEEIPEDVPEVEKSEPIEIKDTDEVGAASDNESDVEVLEVKEPVVEALEIEEGSDGWSDEDDVVLKAEPVEQVVLEDNDTDDETVSSRRERDLQHQLALVKVKQEPPDPDDEPVITAEEERLPTTIETTHTTVTSSIDGNVQLDAAPPSTVLPVGGIKINITKTMPSVNSNQEPMFEDVSADDEPLPPGEEPELEYKLKPHLEGVQFSRQPPVQKGSELSGLCSIM